MHIQADSTSALSTLRDDASEHFEQWNKSFKTINYKTSDKQSRDWYTALFAHKPLLVLPQAIIYAFTKL